MKKTAPVDQELLDLELTNYDWLDAKQLNEEIGKRFAAYLKDCTISYSDNMWNVEVSAPNGGPVIARRAMWVMQEEWNNNHPNGPIV